MLRRWSLVQGTVLITSILAVAACLESTAPDGVPVQLRAGATTSSAGGSVSASRAALTASGLEITSLRLMISEVGLGYGDQFGCIDCEGDDENGNGAPRVVDVPLHGGSVLLETEMASPGTYPEMEIELERSVSPPAGWPSQATIEVAGRNAGESFTIQLSVEGSSRQSLDSPVVVTDQAPASLSATLQFPVRGWFTTSTGRQLDPNSPTDRAAIEQNIRTYFADAEAE